MVGLSAPLVVTVVLPTVRHVPQVLTAPEVLLLVSDPSAKDAITGSFARSRTSRWVNLE